MGVLLVVEWFPVGQKGDRALDVVQAAHLVEYNLLDPVHGICFHLNDDVVDSIEAVNVGDLFDSAQGLDDLGLHTKLSIQ